jgi:hypothetical protein
MRRFEIVDMKRAPGWKCDLTTFITGPFDAEKQAAAPARIVRRSGGAPRLTPASLGELNEKGLSKSVASL